MAVPVQLFVFLLIIGFITDALCYDVMPKPKDCKNKINEKKCEKMLKNKYNGKIYDMCFGGLAMDDCCAFCVERLTCDGGNPDKNDIVDLNIKFMYLTVDCKDTMKYSQCQAVRDNAYKKDTKLMCKNKKYAGMCCTFCKYGMGKNWDNLLIDEWIKHPYKNMQKFLDDYGGLDGYGKDMGYDDNGGYDGGYDKSMDNMFNGFSDGYGKGGKDDDGYGDFINNIINGFGGYGDKGGNKDRHRAKIAPNAMSKMIFEEGKPSSLIEAARNGNKAHLRTRRESENMCEDGIGESNCLMMSKLYKYEGMPHIFCADPHNMASCCQFCSSAKAKGEVNRKHRDLAFQGKTEYPADDEVEPCEGDKLSQSNCSNLLYSKFNGNKRRMCTTIHFGNVCCDSCKKFSKR